MSEKKETTAITERKPTPSERFSMEVQRQFTGEVGSLRFTEYENSLAQHAFIAVDNMMITKNADPKTAVAISWANVNMRKIAIDAVNRVRLGVDALIPGHLYPIAYFNGKTNQYDVDLRVGYRGELYYKRKASAKEIRDIRIELVYDTDEFIVYKRGANCEIEGYDFKITEPFARGELVGGFGYIEYEDGRNNVLVAISKAEIDKYRGVAKGDKFWGPWYDQMAYKTIVHRTMDKIIIDPTKINVTAMAIVEADENAMRRYEDDAPAMLNTAPLTLPADDVPEQSPEQTPAVEPDVNEAVPGDDPF